MAGGRGEGAAGVDVEAILARVRDACASQAVRHHAGSDIDRVVTTAVNVPLPETIAAATLASALLSGAFSPRHAGHLQRFLGELPLADILRFCDRHGIDAARLARFFRTHRQRLALRRPDLEEHLDALVPGP